MAKMAWPSKTVRKPKMAMAILAIFGASAHAEVWGDAPPTPPATGSLREADWHDSRPIKRAATDEGITAKQRLGVEVERIGRREDHGSRRRLPITPASLER